MRRMATQFAVVCAWCNRTLSAAPDGTPITHTICRPCLEWSFLHPSEKRNTSGLAPDSFITPSKH